MRAGHVRDHASTLNPTRMAVVGSLPIQAATWVDDGMIFIVRFNNAVLYVHQRVSGEFIHSLQRREK